VQRARLTILSLLHLVTDWYGSYLLALWLVLRVRFDLDEVQVGWLLAAVMVPSNVMQPLWGALFDRFEAKWFVIIGPALAVVCLSLVGLCGSLAMATCLMVIGMLGVGLFHPEAATLATRFGAAGNPRAMSLFLAAGFLGQGFGPWLISQVVTQPRPAWLAALATWPARGFADSWLTIFPGLLILVPGVILIWRLPAGPRAPRPTRRMRLNVVLAGRHRPVWTLIAMNVARVFGLMMLHTTLPEYLKDRGGGQIQVGNWMLIFLWAQMVGILAGGFTARANRERGVLVGMTALSLVPACVLPFIGGPAVLVAYAATGLCIAWTHPVGVRLSQGIVPGGERWVSGMMIGMSWGIGALAGPPLVGWLCKVHSPQASLAVGAALLLAGTALAMALPAQAHLNRLRKADGVA
jgi:FSR family fosmidomycin resistance protein-like MFS transporter